MCKRYASFILSALILVFFVFACYGEEAPQSSVVKITGEKGSWRLEVNGKPFYIKGVNVTCMTGAGGGDYLKMAQELGANAVRTRETAQGTQEYFDAALKYGLMVNAGIRIDGTDETNKAGIIEYVNKFKNHPALLMWNMTGGMFSASKDEAELAAFVKFLDELAQAMHSADPNHPVIFSAEDLSALAYVKEHAPDIDILGMDIYDSVKIKHAGYLKSGLNTPYVVTEYGPHRPQDVKKDPSGAPLEEADRQKGSIYGDMTREINGFKGYNLGGFAFQLGEITEGSFTWWNVNYKLLKFSSYWEIYRIYSGSKPSNLPPRVASLKLGKTKRIKPGEAVNIFAEAADSDSNPLDYSFAVSTVHGGASEYGAEEDVPVKFYNEGTKFKMTAPDAKGLYRLYFFVNDGYGNAASANRSFKVE